jgi:hypothetical protein
MIPSNASTNGVRCSGGIGGNTKRWSINTAIDDLNPLMARLRNYAQPRDTKRLAIASRGPHARQHAVVQDEAVPKSGECVQACECKERIGQIPVNILGGPKYSAIFLDP